MKNLDLMATTTFGLEAVVKREALALGLENVRVTDGRVHFKGDIEDLVRANLHFRCADRILINMGSFEATSFEMLFEGVKKLPWADWITKNGKFTVLAKSTRSALFSLSDIQSIVKKSVVEKLKLTYPVEYFEESGPEYTITASLVKDIATLTIDSTGAKNGLHKRGYRAQSAVAPLKETLAAGLILLSYWNKSRILLDPTCGSGTIAIEAALIAKNIAPGLNHKAVCETWPQVGADICKKLRSEAYSKIDKEIEPQIFGFDIDSEAIELAKNNANLAGVDDCVVFETKPLSKIELPGKYGVAISNPPYAERMGVMDEVERLYSDMGRVFRDDTWSVYVITSDEFFEEAYGKKANLKRKLFNGNIKVDYYQYQGERPPRLVT
ncbi:MAG: class I SAM-dependent RNA methyltransferase [Turicibacter sp.]|nr:class I SAM-dependent RNA methyltransferase [Turicibacter sp.]